MFRLYCKTCGSDLELIGNDRFDMTFHRTEKGLLELDTSEWSCNCYDEDGNLTVNENDAQDHVFEEVQIQ